MKRDEAMGGGDQAPRTGKALYTWIKRMEREHEVGLLKYVMAWSRLMEFPGLMVGWDAEHVARAHAEAFRKLRSIPPRAPTTQP